MLLAFAFRNCEPRPLECRATAILGRGREVCGVGPPERCTVICTVKGELLLQSCTVYGNWRRPDLASWKITDCRSVDRWSSARFEIKGLRHTPTD